MDWINRRGRFETAPYDYKYSINRTKVNFGIRLFGMQNKSINSIPICQEYYLIDVTQ